MKKLISLLLALMMVLSLATVAFAAGETGSITINGVSSDVKYDLYQLLDLESYDEDEGVYSYKVNATWTSFFNTDEAKNYFKVDTQGYATWINASTDEDTTVAEFAKLALAYAKDHGISPVKSSENAGAFTITGTDGKFVNLALGYYLVDSTVGALCGLTTTNPDAYIVAKNGTPTIDKQVKEDSTGNWGSTDTADIGQTVEFRTTITVQPGAENYVLHDNMSTGLTFDPTSVVVKHITNGKTEADATTATVNTHYTVVTSGLTDGCTFEVRFTDTFCDHIQNNDKVIVHYSATLNENAVIAGTGNPNETKLEYGEKNYTTKDSTTTYAFAFDLVKTDGQNKLIDGAEFKIYDAATGGNEIPVVKLADGFYRRATATETGVVIAVTSGKVRVSGFDNGTYYLEETKTPEGYNQLATRKEFTISNGNLDAIINANNIVSTGSGVHVVNQSGTMLPETGATGTAMFIFFGMFVMLTTGVLLVTKKRMSMIEE